MGRAYRDGRPGGESVPPPKVLVIDGSATCRMNESGATMFFQTGGLAMERARIRHVSHTAN